MVSAVSLRSSSDGRMARAPEASTFSLHPRLPETSLSYFLKLWDEPSPPPFLPGDPLLLLSVLSCVKAPALMWTCVSAHAGEHGAQGFPHPITPCAASVFAHSLPEARAIPSQHPGPATGQGPYLRSASGWVAFPGQVSSDSACPSGGLQEKYFYIFLPFLLTC